MSLRDHYDSVGGQWGSVEIPLDSIGLSCSQWVSAEIIGGHLAVTGGHQSSVRVSGCRWSSMRISAAQGGSVWESMDIIEAK